jgi:hypothetical protein
MDNMYRYNSIRKGRLMNTGLVLVMALAFGASGVSASPGSPTSHRVERADAPGRGASDGTALFERIKRLEGEWTAPMSNGLMTNIFRPIAFGSAVLHEEWLKGEQITATIFYLVGSELRADHFCDFKNQLRYAAKPTGDADVIFFELREALNLDVQPRHFRSTTWRLVDSTHLTQDWQIVEPGKEPRVVRMEFTRKK